MAVMGEMEAITVEFTGFERQIALSWLEHDLRRLRNRRAERLPLTSPEIDRRVEALERVVRKLV